MDIENYFLCIVRAKAKYAEENFPKKRIRHNTQQNAERRERRDIKFGRVEVDSNGDTLSTKFDEDADSADTFNDFERRGMKAAKRTDQYVNEDRKPNPNPPKRAPAPGSRIFNSTSDTPNGYGASGSGSPTGYGSTTGSRSYSSKGSGSGSRSGSGSDTGYGSGSDTGYGSKSSPASGSRSDPESGSKSEAGQKSFGRMGDKVHVPSKRAARYSASFREIDKTVKETYKSTSKLSMNTGTTGPNAGDGRDVRNETPKYYPKKSDSNDGKGDIGEISYNKSSKTPKAPGMKTKFGKIVGNKVKVKKIEENIRRERNEKKYRDK